MATKRIIQLPTLNQNNQVTWSSGKTFVTTTPWAIATSSSWWPTTDGGSYVDYNATTDQSGNVIGGSSGRMTYDSWGKQITNTVKPVPTMWTNKSVAAMNANKNGTTSSLPQATPANLPWVTKYAGIDKNYWNNQAGIDLVNKQNELDTLSEAEKAQRLAGAYNPTPPPTVATAQNPVIKKTLDKPQEQTVTPASLQGADINTLNSTLDELKYKVNVEGKQLTKEEYMTFESARRQLQDMMKPKEYTWFENVINDTKNLIETTKKEESASNAEELARYTESQNKRKESQLAILDEQEMTSKKRLASILWWSGQWQSTDTGEQFKALEDSFTLRKQEKINEMQDRIDLYGATLRKDSKETIQALEKRLADQQMKVVDIDLKNLDIINAYNEKQWLSQLEKIDKLQQMADDIIANNTPLTDQQKADAAMRSNKIIKPDWTFDRELWEILKKQNPMIAAEAVRQSTAIQNERIQSELAMKWLDADIKRAQLNKLLNPEIDWKDSGEVDANGNPILYDPKNPTNTTVIPVWSTDIWWLSWADLAKTLASWKIDWKKFFGVYATGDPDGQQFASIYNKAAEQWLDAYMKSRQDRWSKITVDMVNQASIATGVDPITIAAKMAQDSWMGTQGKGARNNNPWNVGQFDSLDAKWITVKGYPTLAEWVLAVAENFRKRQDALLSVAPQKKSSADVNKIYQILTEAGQADWVAKNNAKTLASSWKTIEQIQQEYPNKDDQYRIRDVTDSVSKAYESFNKSNTKLDSIMRILKDPNASGKSIEVALKSFVSAIDNTAAMAWEVAQARDAWLSDIDALQARLIKIGSWKVKDSIKKDIENTISQFHQWIQWAYDDYFDIQQWSLKTQYWDTRANKLNLYRRQWPNQSQVAWQISSDRK